MDYGNLLRRSWDIVWHNKFLFVLGFLAALGGGGSNGGGGNTGFNFDSGDVPAEIIEQLQQFWAQFGPLVIGLACLGFIIAIVFWLIRLTAQGGMISAVSQIETGEKVTFGQAFAAGTSKLGRMVGLNVIMYGLFTLLGLLAAGFALGTVGAAIGAELAGASSADVEALFGSLGVFGICVACLFCLLVPLLILVTAVYPFAQRGVILQDLGAVDSIRHGWEILKANTSDVVLLIILFIVLGIVFGVVTAIVLLPLAVFTLLPGVLRMVDSGAVQALDIVMLVGGGICLGLVGAAVNSIMVAFRSTAVTLAYQEFIGKKA